MVYDWQNDPEWGDDGPDEQKRALLYILLATACLGLAMLILWQVAASLP